MTRLAIAAFVLSLVLALSSAGVTIYLLANESANTKDFSAELRDGLVASCETNGNPLREAVQGQLREQIKQRETLDFAKFFPNVPRGELEQLARQQNEADRATLERIAPVNCSALYPKP